MSKDKLYHLLVGAIFGVATYLSGHWLLGFVLATIVFVIKEVYDMYKPNPTGFDTLDLTADYIGLLLGFWFAGMLHGLINILV